MTTHLELVRAAARASVQPQHGELIGYRARCCDGMRRSALLMLKSFYSMCSSTQPSVMLALVSEYPLFPALDIYPSNLTEEMP